MKFNVGPGIEAKMEELNDYAVKDSTFAHPISQPAITTEFGYGMYNEYIASNAGPNSAWEVVAYARSKSS